MPLLLEIERAEGCWLYGHSGKAWLDLIGGISVSALGHRHPKVVDAVKSQLDQYMHTQVYGEYILAPQVKLAELLAKSLNTTSLPEGAKALDTVYFTNSGSEATEGAMKLAKRYTDRPEIIACRNAYHGSTQGAASLMEPTTFTQAFHPLLPGIRHINFNKEEDLEKISPKTACVIVETVQAESGVHPPENGYLKKLRQRCDKTGTLLVLDEIQAGYGRTGTLWAFQQYGIVPDILLLAKAMGGGMPIGAFVASTEIMQSLSFEPPLGHITTFGGNPVCCAAALATLQVLLQEDYISKVKEKEKLFRQLLVHPAIREVRSAGLLMAVEVADFPTLRKVQLKCLDEGVVTDWFLFNDRSLRIAPPLTISEEDIELACRTILRSLDG
jgi:acetylornithine/succinyldiaminopimelate/putrescine aminotransferase